MQNLKIAKRLLDCVISGVLTETQEQAVLVVVCELVKPDYIVKLVAVTLDERIREVYNAGQGGNKISAIKLHRTATGAGLVDSKNYVEKLLDCAYVPPRY